jgi:hypothetical protein
MEYFLLGFVSGFFLMFLLVTLMMRATSPGFSFSFRRHANPDREAA